MSTTGFWAWWESRTGQIVGLTLFLVLQILLRLLDLHGTAHDIAGIVVAAVTLPAAVFAGVGYFRRKLRDETEKPAAIRPAGTRRPDAKPRSISPTSGPDSCSPAW